MSLYIDKKFVSLVSPKLQRFQQKSEFLWNFRCPICNDSQKNKAKARGYVYRKKSDLFFLCHNCGTSLSLGNFIKLIDPSTYREYQLERFKNESHGNTPKPDFSLAKTKPVFKTKINLPTIKSLPEDHFAKQYVKKRKLPDDAELYFASDFKTFVLEMLPNYDKKLYQEPRIVIPFYDENKTLLGFQGRALEDGKIKYITVKMDEDFKKVFGLDRVDFSKRIYVVEGPFDSLFLQNCVATMDASLYNISLLLGNHDYVFIHDNEPRNAAIVKQMAKTISHNKNIFIWPQGIVSKDINDYILSGGTASEIQRIIDTNTFEGLRAKLEYERWRKV